MADPADQNLDELRRHARRRLVGAVVLALVVAVAVPMLLEREPKPLGNDVSVQIPPVDSGKFVNRLSDPAQAATSADAPSNAPAPALPRPPVDSSQHKPADAHPSATWAVQLAAFSDDKGANALALRLKQAGYSAYTEPLRTSKGTLWRVRVGPYPTHDDAAAARERLKREGHSGIVAASD